MYLSFAKSIRALRVDHLLFLWLLISPVLGIASVKKDTYVSENQNQDEITISGTVTDEEGLPLIGVTVMVKSATIGTITYQDGFFTITIPSDIQKLVFSFVGYITQEVSVSNRTSIDIVLYEDFIELEEVVATGYAFKKKANLTGSVASVNSRQIESRGVVNVSSALSGQLPGVTILQRGGSPGRDEGTVRIRGIGTFGNSNPLIIVDGVETGSLSELGINDIESISVLKDASSSAIYGVRAANGVILVTTKRGVEGKLQVSYQGQFGFSEATRLPEKVNSHDLATLYNEALKNEGSPSRFSREELDKFKEGNTETYANTDHIGELFSEPGTRHMHSLNLSGGSADTQYNIGLGYSLDGGLIPNTSYSRYSIRANIDHQVGEKLKLGMNLATSVREVIEPALGVSWVMHTAYREWATDILRFSDGRWAYPTHAENQGHNSLAYASDLGNKNTNDTRISGTLFAEYEILEGFSIKGLFSNIRDLNNSKTWIQGVDLYDIDPQTGIIGDLPNQNHYGVTSRVARDYFMHSDFNVDLYLKYDKAFGYHHIGGLLGYNQRKTFKEWDGLSRTNLIHRDLDQIDAADHTNDNTYGRVIDYRSRSVFGRLSYTFQNRYLFEGNIRYDGSSRFPDTREQRFEFFPSFSAGWRVSEEEFFNVPFISYLKLRGSWGQLGNQEIYDYAYFYTYVTGADYILNNQIAAGVAEKSNAPNTDIRWETSTSTNLGFDVGFFRQKLSVVADFFIKNTEDILGQVPLRGVFGAEEPLTNQLSVQNKGFEFKIDYVDHIGKFDYSIGANFSKVVNEITDLAGTDSPGRQIGDPIANIYGFQALSLFQNQEEIDSSPDQSALGGTTYPGDIKYADINGDGTINADDRSNLGSYFPGMAFGLNLTASYFGFDFSMVWQGVGDVEALISGRQQQPFVLGASPWQIHLDRAIIRNEELTNPEASNPRTTFGNANNYVPSTWWVKSTSFIKLRNVQLGYNLPKQLVQKLRIEQARIYLSGENLWTITSFEGFDPETPTIGDPLGLGSTNGYPPVRTILIGINLSF